MIEELYTIFKISACAFVWGNILTEPGNIFAFVLKPFQEWEGWKSFIIKPLSCAVCLSGQIALWYSFINLELIHVCPFTLTTIFITYVFEKLLL
mgnify:CR=1 FL=1